MKGVSMLDLNSAPSIASHRPVIICGECGQAVEVLTKIHIAKHGLTQQEYLRRHPDHCYLHMWPDLPNFKNQEKYRRWRERLGVTETETAQETR
jgi:hypothetical protein